MQLRFRSEEVPVARKAAKKSPHSKTWPLRRAHLALASWSAAVIRRFWVTLHKNGKTSASRQQEFNARRLTSNVQPGFSKAQRRTLLHFLFRWT
jgi:hypothetical protein